MSIMALKTRLRLSLVTPGSPGRSTSLEELGVALLSLLHSGPETLLLLQTVALALGGIPLLLLGLRRLPELPLVAAAFVGAYLVTPEILGEALYDFHALALATPLLLLALWALDAQRYRWFVVAAVLAALCKEEVALSLVPL